MGWGCPMVKKKNKIVVKTFFFFFHIIIIFFWKRWLGRVQVSSSVKFSSHFLIGMILESLVLASVEAASLLCLWMIAH
jgi:uncharacterized membrane protein (DUF485 family)